MSNLLDEARRDFFALAQQYPAAVPALRQAVVDGRIDGLSYHLAVSKSHGQVGCVLCWIGHACTISAYAISMGRRRADGYILPIEQFVIDVTPGDTPATSPELAALLSWIDAWQSEFTADELADAAEMAVAR